MLCLNLSVLVKRVVQGGRGESFFCAKKVGSFSSEREKSLKYLRLKAFWRGRIPLGVLLMAKVLSPSFFLAWRKLLGGLNGCIMSG